MEILAKSKSDRGQKVKNVIFNIIQIGRVTTLKNRKKISRFKNCILFSNRIISFWDIGKNPVLERVADRTPRSL